VALAILADVLYKKPGGDYGDYDDSGRYGYPVPAVNQAGEKVNE